MRNGQFSPILGLAGGFLGVFFCGFAPPPPLDVKVYSLIGLPSKMSKSFRNMRRMNVLLSVTVGSRTAIVRSASPIGSGHN